MKMGDSEVDTLMSTFLPCRWDTLGDLGPEESWLMILFRPTESLFGAPSPTGKRTNPHPLFARRVEEI